MPELQRPTLTPLVWKSFDPKPCGAHPQGAAEEETGRLAAALKGSEFKLAAYKRENGKLFDGQQDAEASISGVSRSQAPRAQR